jgi:hypothetical protein
MVIISSINHEHPPIKWFKVSINSKVMDDAMIAVNVADIKNSNRLRDVVQMALMLRGSPTRLDRVDRWNLVYDDKTNMYRVEYAIRVKIPKDL